MAPSSRNTHTGKEFLSIAIWVNCPAMEAKFSKKGAGKAQIVRENALIKCRGALPE
jgi:hypothetical protein